MAQLTRQRATEVGEKIGSGLDDAWIHTKIRTKLVGEGELPFAGVNVDVVDKVVTLRGTVESATAKDTAERVSKATNGVTQVHNRLVVKKNG
ncbi:MAG: BON domain-containing protein [Acidobacteriota bacterium]